MLCICERFLFFFRSKLAHFKRFCFVSISNQFDIESFIIEVIYNFKFVGQMRYGTPDKIFFCLVKPKMNNNSVSCLRLLSHFSSLTSPCLHSTVSRLLSLVSCSCLMSPVSHLLFHASCLVSCLLSHIFPAVNANDLSDLMYYLPGRGLVPIFHPVPNLGHPLT